MSGKSLTQPQMILLALHKASGGTTKRVPYEELVLQAWRDFPQAFSLRNHPEHPDPSDIHKRIYDNLKPGGYVVSLKNKVFRLTEKGIEEAERLLTATDGNTEPSKAAMRLARDEQRFVEHAVSTEALRVWQANQQDKLVEYDARIFFQFSTGTSIDDRKMKVRAAFEALEKAEQLSIGGASQALGLAKFLMERFPHLLGED